MGCKVYKEGVGLFVWAKLPEVYLQKNLLIRFYRRSYFIAPGTIFGSNGEGYIRFALCVKKKKSTGSN
jgi:aspartate/methionine/tyrosine aminotransferase